MFHNNGKYHRENGITLENGIHLRKRSFTEKVIFDLMWSCTGTPVASTSTLGVPTPLHTQ